MNSSDVVRCRVPGAVRGHHVYSFRAMACPCEIHVRGGSVTRAAQLAREAQQEALRIERKFSRYRNDNLVWAINHSGGNAVSIDDETYQLLRYAGECHRLSGGLFDITSGVLRRAWNFDGRDVEPDRCAIEKLLGLVGWEQVTLTPDTITLPRGMEIDLGGLGKEYAVDRVAQQAVRASDLPVMVNFGGDIRIPRPGGRHATWKIGVADPESPDRPAGEIELEEGAVTTSGVSYRHCFVNGRRLGHILDPRTGWPVEDAPRSVTVVADFCLVAGMYSTLAMLQGAGAEAFLDAQGLAWHCFR